MKNFSDTIAGFRFDGALKGRVDENWLQGRTLYGGMTAALCLEGALRNFPGLPPLRSAQVSFIGPAEGEIEVVSTILRQGKSVTFVNADISGDKGLAARAVFAFGAARASMFAAHFMPPADLPGAGRSAPFFPSDDTGPGFARNFEVRLARGGIPFSESQETDHYHWVRHRDENAVSASALLALADMPPPAVFPMFPRFAPISTMTWSMNFLTDDRSTSAGWWLLRTSAENASEGYSSQDMFVWNAMGEPVIAGRQSVAIFI